MPPKRLADVQDEHGNVSMTKLLGFTPKQQQALDTFMAQGIKFALYGGAAGGGKSYFLRWFAVFYLMYVAAQYGIAARVMVACEDYPSLKLRQLDKVQEEFPDWLGRYFESKREYKLHGRFGGGTIVFCNLDNPQKYSSAEFALIEVDEITLSDYETFLELRQRLRYPGIPDWMCKLIGSCNPVGRGLGWVKRLFITKTYDNQNDRPEMFAFVQAFVSDNPHIDQAYADSLSSLPEDRRRAILEGDWDVFKGMAFGEWARDIHVCDPFDIPAQAPRYRALDWGIYDPAVCLWVALWENTVYVYRELKVTDLPASQVAAMIKSATPTGETIHANVGDPSMFKRDGTTAQSVAQVFAQNGIAITPGKNERVAGLNRVKEWLRPFDVADRVTGALQRTARLKVFSTCVGTIDSLANLPYDEKKMDDVVTRGVEDHHYDALRYILMHLHAPAPVPGSQPVAEKFAPTREEWLASQGFAPRWRQSPGDGYSSGW